MSGVMVDLVAVILSGLRTQECKRYNCLSITSY